MVIAVEGYSWFKYFQFTCMCTITEKRNYKEKPSVGVRIPNLGRASYFSLNSQMLNHITQWLNCEMYTYLGLALLLDCVTLIKLLNLLMLIEAGKK